MADLDIINPRKDRRSRQSLYHFVGKFPTTILRNNLRVDLGYFEFSSQLLDLGDYAARDSKVEGVLLGYAEN